MIWFYGCPKFNYELLVLNYKMNVLKIGKALIKAMQILPMSAIADKDSDRKRS